MTLNVVKLLQFVSFSVLACPPNFVWQAFLEAQFPAYTTTLSPAEKETLVDDAVSGKSSSVDASTLRRVQARTMSEKSSEAQREIPAKRLSVRNTAAKFTLDQTIGAAANVRP